jgi:ABC-type spermidine/putrescine transport system permease subunit I
MIGLSITNQFIKVGNLGLGSALSFVLLIVLVLIVAGVRWVTRRSIQQPASQV